MLRAKVGMEGQLCAGSVGRDVGQGKVCELESVL